MERFKANVRQGVDLGAVSREIGKTGAADTYIADKEPAIFFHAEDTGVLTKVRSLSGVQSVHRAGDGAAEFGPTISGR